jgi:5-formyltetrahydrofolate cyclo-ligase
MTKKECRNYFKQKRLELSADELNRRSELICETLFSRFQLEGKTISLFLPIERHKEINTYFILEKGMSIGVNIGLPKISESDHTLKHYLYESPDQLAINTWGIPEPVKGKLIKPRQLDVVFVPLLAIDKSGHRVGYGKGYYDRFLQKCHHQCLFIGLHLFDEVSVIEDIDTHDIPLNYCITPSTIVSFEKK